MKHLAILLAGFALSTTSLRAQSAGNGVPDSHRPPPGMCRIWIDGVPPSHQPAPTDCATAIRKRPLNARVVFGSDTPTGDRNLPPAQTRESNLQSPNVPSREEQERAAQQQHDEQERQRIAQQQREAQDRHREEAQREREEQAKREASHAPPPPSAPRAPERVAPPPRQHPEKSQRPPHSSFSSRRPG